MQADFPLTHEILYQDPLQTFSLFHKQHGAIFLDSSKISAQLGRYSFITIDPFLTLSSKNGVIKQGEDSYNGNPFLILQKLLKQYPLLRLEGFPPFQGGACGYFGYDLYQHLENIPDTRDDDVFFQDMIIGFYDLVIAFDHTLQKTWIFSSGYPEQQLDKRREQAKKRCIWLSQLLEQSPASSDLPSISGSSKFITANFNQESYEQAVSRVIDYIYAGDIFEANISQRFSSPLPDNISPFQLYCRLRHLNSAPFSSYLNLDETVIASSSPERFLRLDQHQVETRPIKGTRKRGKTPTEDAVLANELMNSEKDKAENVMIVDLMRNDLSRVCKAHTVKVPQLCRLESYATVHHLVSVVTGKLNNQFDAIDLLTTTFPGGSISGAPKIRAMEIINEIEPTRRGPYCGCIGYIGFNGDMDTAITIRTYAIKNNTVFFQAGGAIVADSNPTLEYEETLNKAWALRKALSTAL